MVMCRAVAMRLWLISDKLSACHPHICTCSLTSFSYKHSKAHRLYNSTLCRCEVHLCSLVHSWSSTTTHCLVRNGAKCLMRYNDLTILLSDLSHIDIATYLINSISVTDEGSELGTSPRTVFGEFHKTGNFCQRWKSVTLALDLGNDLDADYMNWDFNLDIVNDLEDDCHYQCTWP